MSIRIIFVVATLLLVSACSDPADLVIHDANIVDVETGEIQQHKSIEIRGDEISGIYDQQADLVAEETINASGKYVIPGLWDMHVHFRGGDSLVAENRALLDLYVANGVTTVRDAGGDLTTSILDWRKQIERRELVGPHIYTSGPKLDGPDARWPGSLELKSPDEVPAAIDSLQELNADYVKLYSSTISADVYLAAIQEAEQQGLLVTGHMPFSVDFNEAVGNGLDATEHMYYLLKGASAEEELIAQNVANGTYGFWGSLNDAIDTYDEEAANQTYEQMAEAGTAVVPTLHIGKVLAYLNEEDHSEDPYLNYIGPGIQETYQGRLEAARRQSEEATMRRRNLRSVFMDMIPNIHEAGVPILAGSDSGPFNSFVYPGISLHKELEQMVAAGLSPLAALQTSVINGPTFFGVSDHYGQVQKGYAADLLLLNNNPLDDISNTQDIHNVVLHGKPMGQERLNKLKTR